VEQATLPVLAHWESFYVIVGSAAAALTGLQFIVITLVAQRSSGSPEGNRAYGTPTIVHFCAVLFIAAVLSAPWLSLAGVAFILGLSGAAALVYAAVILRIVRRLASYTPVLEDWIWHFTLPPIAYAIVLVTAFTVQDNPTLSLFAIAGVVLLLLFIGIHNAWDSVTFTALNQRQQAENREEGKD
jgi:hypothetical protein